MFNYLKSQVLEKIDTHWRPQWTFCPFCSLQFDLVGKLEDFESDFQYLAESLGVQVTLQLALVAVD